MDTFENRKLVQKLVYLLDSAGIRTGFKFNWYLHGPYSPELTRQLYQTVNSKTNEDEHLSPDELKLIGRFKKVLGPDVHSPDRLELLASIEYIKNSARDTYYSEDDVVTAIRRMKPYFHEDEIRRFYKKSQLLAGHQ